MLEVGGNKVGGGRIEVGGNKKRLRLRARKFEVRGC